MIDLGEVRHGVDTNDPFAALEAIADDLLIIAAAIHRADDDDPIGRAVERASHRMNDALSALQGKIEAGTPKHGAPPAGPGGELRCIRAVDTKEGQ